MQIAVVEHDIADYQVIPGLQCPSTELYEEWLIAKLCSLFNYTIIYALNQDTTKELDFIWPKQLRCNVADLGMPES